MCTCSTAKRRRRQASNGYAHLDEMRRPFYKKTSLAKAQRHLQMVIERERRIMQAGKKKKAA
jgi:hypothetical protein